MTKPQQLIRQILDAAATGKLEDAEKDIEEYVKKESLLLIDWINEVGHGAIAVPINNPWNLTNIPEKVYQQYINQK